MPKKEVESFKARYNISPTQTSPIIVQSGSERHVEPMRWGFMPAWSKDPKDVYKYKMFNTRAEGVFEKRTWSKAIKFQRCLVPADSFFEWRGPKGDKQKFMIKPKDQDLFAFAGLFGHWKDAEGHDWSTYSIITTEPNREMGSIHDRMPVILQPDDMSLWLEPSLDEPDAISQLMKPYKDGMLDIVEVNSDVIRSGEDEANYIKPLNSQ